MDDILVYIEIAKNTNVKYEFDKTMNALICDRVLFTPFSFPFNYGFIPDTLSGDGDPLDAIVFMEESLIPGCYIKCRIIGCLETIDDNGEDTKIILVPAKNVSPMEKNIESIEDLPDFFIEKIKYFYQHYKDLENKKVTIGKLLDKKEAIKVYEKSMLINKPIVNLINNETSIIETELCNLINKLYIENNSNTDTLKNNLIDEEIIKESEEFTKEAELCNFKQSVSN
jgi:inorganic pyrophosphatase